MCFLRTLSHALLFSLILNLTACPFISDSDTDRPVDFRISAGYSSGNYHKFSKGLVYAMDKAWFKNVKLMESEGSYENLQNLIRKKADFALVQQDVLEKIKADPASHEDIEISASLEVLFVAYLETVHLLVNTKTVKPSTDINGDGVLDIKDITVNDLQDKVVNTGAIDSGSYVTAHNVLSANKVTCSYIALSSKNAVAKVVSGEIDACFYTTGLPNSLFEEINSNAPVTLVRVQYPHDTNAYTYDTVSWLDYPFQKFDLTDTLHVRSLFVTTKGAKYPFIGSLLDYLNDASSIESSDTSVEFPDHGTNNTLAFLSHKYSELWSGFSLADTRNYFICNPETVNDTVVRYLYSYVNESPNPASRIMTGSASGSYSKIADDLLTLVNSEGTPYLQLSKQLSSGSFENMSSLYDGECTMAIVQDDVFEYLKDCKSEHDSLKVWMARKIVPLYLEYIHVIVNKTANVALLDASGAVMKDTTSGETLRDTSKTIETIADLKGLNVCLCEKTSGSFISGITILKSYGFSQKDAPKYFFTTPEIAAVKVANGEYDALIKVTANDYDLLTDKVIPVYEDNVQIAGLDEDELAAAGYLGAGGTTDEERKANFTKELFFEKIKLIPGIKNPSSFVPYSTGTLSYAGICENITTSTVRSILIAHQSFNDEEVGAMIKSLYVNKDSLTFISSKGSINRTEAVDYFKTNPYNWSESAQKYFLKLIADSRHTDEASR